MDEDTFGSMTLSATALEEILADLEDRSRSFGLVLSGALRQAATGSKGLEDILRGVGTRLADIALSVGLKPLETLAGSAVSAIAGNLGGALSVPQTLAAPQALSAPVTPFATGGIVAAPTYFAMEGGGGLMGEAGPEAILPLKRGSDGALGIVASGGAAPVQIVFNVTSPDAESFRRSEGQIAAMLARSVGRGQRNL